MRTLKRLVKKLLLLVLSERDLIKCSFVLKRAFRTAHLLVFVYCSITSRLFKKPLGGGAVYTGFTRFARFTISARYLYLDLISTSYHHTAPHALFSPFARYSSR